MDRTLDDTREDHRAGEDELAAMTDLRVRLDERRRAAKLAEIDRRGRLAYLDGAEAQSQAAERPAADGRRVRPGDEAVSGLTRA